MKTDIDEAIVTIHGASRLKERCKVKNSRSAKKNITRAFQRGKHATDCTSWEKAFLMKECHNDCTAIAYNGFCYVFNSNNVCCIRRSPAAAGAVVNGSSAVTAAAV